MKNLILNIIGTLTLAMAVTTLGIYIFCLTALFQPLCSSWYSYLGFNLVAVVSILLAFFWTQYNKTHDMIKPKPKRANPLPLRAGYAAVFQKTEKLLSDVWHAGDNATEATEELGWLILFEDDTRVVVSHREYYHWLLGIVQAERDIKKADKEKTKCALSQRENLKLGRKRWKAYRHLLEQTNVLVEVNKNVVVLKDEYSNNPWQIIELINQITQIVKV